jgi:hypothetical protein
MGQSFTLAFPRFEAAKFFAKGHRPSALRNDNRRDRGSPSAAPAPLAPILIAPCTPGLGEGQSRTCDVPSKLKGCALTLASLALCKAQEKCPGLDSVTANFPKSLAQIAVAWRYILSHHLAKAR